MGSLGDKIKDLRTKKGWSQEELASFSSLNLRTIQRIESNRNQPRGKSLQLICEALGIPIDKLNIQKRDSKFKLILLYLSATSFLIFPFLNIALPYLIWKSDRANINRIDEEGKRLINFQILWSIFTVFFIAIFAWNKLMHNHSSPFWGYGFLASIGLNLLLSVLFILFTLISVKKVKYPKLIRFINR